MASTALHRAPRTRRPLRGLLFSAGLLVVVVAMALLGAGGSYAAWNSSTATNASSVSSGTTSLTVNGVSDYTFPNLNLAGLGPGQSVSVPLTIANTGSTALSTVVSQTTIVSDSNGLSAELTAAITASSTCSASTSTGTTMAGTRLASFTTTASPITLAAGASLPICLDIRMDLDAPMSVAGGSTTFSMAITATQVR
jgi:predicted ribosomally synthesized peptide with SipW-like signal peptide